MRSLLTRAGMAVVVTCLTLSVATAGAAASPAAEQTPGQLSAGWWRWAGQLSAEKAPCAQKQFGGVFFVSELTAAQNCTLARGRTIFASVINFEWSATEARKQHADPQKGWPAFCGRTDALDLLACASWQAGHVRKAAATLDGKRLPLIVAVAPSFYVTWTENNPFGVKPGGTRAAAVGLYVKFLPTAGVHTLRLHGRADFSRDLGFVYEPVSTVRVHVG